MCVCVYIQTHVRWTIVFFPPLNCIEIHIYVLCACVSSYQMDHCYVYFHLKAMILILHVCHLVAYVIDGPFCIYFVGASCIMFMLNGPLCTLFGSYSQILHVCHLVAKLYICKIVFCCWIYLVLNNLHFGSREVLLMDWVWMVLL